MSMTYNYYKCWMLAQNFFRKLILTLMRLVVKFTIFLFSYTLVMFSRKKSREKTDQFSLLNATILPLFFSTWRLCRNILSFDDWHVSRMKTRWSDSNNDTWLHFHWRWLIKFCYKKKIRMIQWRSPRNSPCMFSQTGK